MIRAAGKQLVAGAETDAIMAANQQPAPGFGSDLDPNRAGNVDDQLRQAAIPQMSEQYFMAEFGDWEPAETVGRALAERAGNGVANNPDGSYEHRSEGERFPVAEQGGLIDHNQDS